MGAVSPKEAGLENTIDVIVQYTKDGMVIPIRIKIQDEDGMYQTYSIRQFREKTITGDYTLPSGIKVTSNKNKVFEVKIVNFGQEKTLNLFFDGVKWYLR